MFLFLFNTVKYLFRFCSLPCSKNKSETSQFYPPETDHAIRQAAQKEKILNNICRILLIITNLLTISLLFAAFYIKTIKWQCIALPAVLTILLYLLMRSNFVYHKNHKSETKTFNSVPIVYSRKKHIVFIALASYLGLCSAVFFILAFLDVIFLAPAIASGLLSAITAIKCKALARQRK